MSRFCYYKWTHGLRFPKPVLLLPVEHIRRVSPLVSELKAQSIQKTPVAETPGFVFMSLRPSASNMEAEEVMHAGS
jgi:hypothetical protein